MEALDTHDRSLIAALQQDGRATITALSSMLGLSRVTVQSRLDRLIRKGVIRRFTVELSASGRHDLVRAVMMIELQGALARTVIRRLRKIPEIVDLHTTNGTWDLVAEIETTNLPEFDRVLGDVREISGVLNSETCLLLNSATA